MKISPFVLLFTILIIATNSNALEISKSKPAKNLKHYTGLEQCPDAQVYPSSPGAALWLETIGTSYYEFQSNGSSGHCSKPV